MRILKTEIPIDDRWHEETVGPIVHVGHQEFGLVTFWWWDDVSMAKNDRQFRVYGTGHEVTTGLDPQTGLVQEVHHRGTAVDHGRKLVWHLIERKLSRPA